MSDRCNLSIHSGSHSFTRSLPDECDLAPRVDTSERLSRCLLVKDPHATSILTGRKLWEIRGSATKVRGRVGIAKSGTGKIFGSVEVIGSRPVTLEELLASPNLPPDEHEMFARIGQFYPRPHAWILHEAVLFDKPRPFRHPPGAVIWVTLE